MNKTLLVFGKEIRIMIRDRRLVIGVAVISLIVMPFMMGFIGNMDEMFGSNDAPVDVFLFFEEEEVKEMLKGVDGIRILDNPGPDRALSEGAITIMRDEAAYRVYGEALNPQISDAWKQIRTAFETLRKNRIQDELERRGLSAAILSPFTVDFEDTGSEASESGLILSILVPYLVIILLVANSIRATYIAVGEKQQNTIASLLVSSAPRVAIVLGKSFAIVTFAIFSSLLLIVGMILFANAGFSIGGPMTEVSYSLSLQQILQLAVNIISIALFVSSVIMFLGTYARNAREAGVYTAPLIYIAIILAVFSMSQSTFAREVYAIPILGNSLAMKDTFLNSVSPLALALPIVSNMILFACFLYGSIRLYEKESVLFRD